MKLFFLLFCFVSNGFSQIKQDTLTNKKIIGLVRSGMSDLIIKKSIESAAYINVDLSSEGLIFLKQNKVSDSIILDLFDRASGNSVIKQNPQELQKMQVPQNLTSLEGQKPGIYYSDESKKLFRLFGLKSTMQMGSKYPGIKWFYEFSGESAQLKINNHSPEFFLVVGTNLSGTVFEPTRFVVIHTDVKKGNRQFNVSNGTLGIKSVTGPTTFDKSDGLVKPDFIQLSENVYKIKFEKKFPPGKYFFAPSQIIKDNSMEFFEFDIY
jgi:hypothetical protein